MIKDAASWRDGSCMFKVMVFTEANSRLEDGSPGSQLGGRGLSGPLAVRAWQSLPTPVSCWWHDAQVPLVSLFSLHLQVYFSTLAKGGLNQDCPSLTAVIQFEGLFTGACICTVVLISSRHMKVKFCMNTVPFVFSGDRWIQSLTTRRVWNGFY